MHGGAARHATPVASAAPTGPDSAPCPLPPHPPAICSTRLKRQEVSFAVIQLADEIFARLVEMDVHASPTAAAELAASLLAILPPPAEPGAAASPAFEPLAVVRSFMDAPPLRPTELVAIFRRLGRRCGSQARAAGAGGPRGGWWGQPGPRARALAPGPARHRHPPRARPTHAQPRPTRCPSQFMPCWTKPARGTTPAACPC